MIVASKASSDCPSVPGSGTLSRLDFRTAQRTHGLDRIAERNAFDELHHDVVEVFFATNPVDGHDIRVMQPRGGFGFASKSRELLFRSSDVLPEDL